MTSISPLSLQPTSIPEEKESLAPQQKMKVVWDISGKARFFQKIWKDKNIENVNQIIKHKMIMLDLGVDDPIAHVNYASLMHEKISKNRPYVLAIVEEADSNFFIYDAENLHRCDQKNPQTRTPITITHYLATYPKDSFLKYVTTIYKTKDEKGRSEKEKIVKSLMTLSTEEEIPLESKDAENTQSNKLRKEKIAARLNHHLELYKFFKEKRPDDFRRRFHASALFKSNSNDINHCYMLGQALVDFRKIDLAKTFFLKAAEAGHGPSCYSYAEMLASQIDCDPVQVVSFFKKSLEDEKSVDTIKAHIRLAEYYAKGFGVELSEENAIKHYKEAGLQQMLGEYLWRLVQKYHFQTVPDLNPLFETLNDDEKCEKFKTSIKHYIIFFDFLLTCNQHFVGEVEFDRIAKEFDGDLSKLVELSRKDCLSLWKNFLLDLVEQRRSLEAKRADNAHRSYILDQVGSITEKHFEMVSKEVILYFKEHLNHESLSDFLAFEGFSPSLDVLLGQLHFLRPTQNDEQKLSNWEKAAKFNYPEAHLELADHYFAKEKFDLAETHMFKLDEIEDKKTNEKRGDTIVSRLIQWHLNSKRFTQAEKCAFIIKDSSLSKTFLCTIYQNWGENFVGLAENSGFIKHLNEATEYYKKAKEKGLVNEQFEKANQRILLLKAKIHHQQLAKFEGGALETEEEKVMKELSKLSKMPEARILLSDLELKRAKRIFPRIFSKYSFDMEKGIQEVCKIYQKAIQEGGEIEIRAKLELANFYFDLFNKLIKKIPHEEKARKYLNLAIQSGHPEAIKLGYKRDVRELEHLIKQPFLLKNEEEKSKILNEMTQIINRIESASVEKTNEITHLLNECRYILRKINPPKRPAPENSEAKQPLLKKQKTSHTEE